MPHRSEAGRDLRLDFVRGLCALGMVCNHVAGTSWARTISLSNNVLITPAEGFVFLSGYVFGIVYRGEIARHGLGAALHKGLRRTATLYKLTVILSLVFQLALLYDQGQDVTSLGDVAAFVANIVLLHQTVYLVDAMLMYTLLVPIGCLGLWLLASGRTIWLLAGSAAFWLAYQVDPTWAGRLPWEIGGNTVFHLTAWQLLFVAGLTTGFHRERLGVWYARHQRMAVAAAALVCGGLVYLELAYGQQPWVQSLSSKPAEGPIRLLACAFVFQLVRLLLTHAWRPLHTSLGWLLLPLGQHSLYTYTMHVGLIALMWQPAQRVAQSEAWNTALQLGTALAVWWLIKRRVLFSLIPR